MTSSGAARCRFRRGHRLHAVERRHHCSRLDPSVVSGSVAVGGLALVFRRWRLGGSRLVPTTLRLPPLVLNGHERPRTHDRCSKRNGLSSRITGRPRREHAAGDLDDDDYWALKADHQPGCSGAATARGFGRARTERSTARSQGWMWLVGLGVVAMLAGC